MWQTSHIGPGGTHGYCVRAQEWLAVGDATRVEVYQVLSPKLWYGMPAYAKDGKVVCFFRGGDKFKERYMTLFQVSMRRFL